MGITPWLNTSSPVSPGVTRIFPSAILMAALWWVLTDGQTSSWIVGIPVIVFATGASLWFRSHELWRWRLVGLGRFFPVFVWQSVRAGFEVAILAFHPRCPLVPGLLTYHLRLPAGPSRIFFTNTVSLSPGTFSADLEGDRLTIHVLDEQFVDRENLKFMESLIADLFGVQLATGVPLREERHE